MKRVMAALIGSVLVLGAVGSALAGPEDENGNSGFGKCIAQTSGSENGKENKYNNGSSFQRMFEDLEDQDGDDDVDYMDAVLACQEFLSDPDNRPGKSGDNGNGRPGQGGGNGEEPAGCPPAGDITGILVQAAQALKDNAPAEAAVLGDTVIEIACALFELTGL